MSMLSLEEACHFMWREELTDWGEHKITNHIYISKGTDLMGYVARRTGVIHMFNTPKKSWSVSRRKFRKLNKKEIREIVENNS
jgi:hypothetical protein